MGTHGEETRKSFRNGGEGRGEGYTHESAEGCKHAGDPPGMYFSGHLKTASVITDAAGNTKAEIGLLPLGW
jgi:hypothetical protein